MGTYFPFTLAPLENSGATQQAELSPLKIRHQKCNQKRFYALDWRFNPFSRADSLLKTGREARNVRFICRCVGIRQIAGALRSRFTLREEGQPELFWGRRCPTHLARVEACLSATIDVNTFFAGNRKRGKTASVKYWEIIADRLHAKGWSYRIAEHLTKHELLFCVDAHRDGKRFIVKGR